MSLRSRPRCHTAGAREENTTSVSCSHPASHQADAREAQPSECAQFCKRSDGAADCNVLHKQETCKSTVQQQGTEMQTTPVRVQSHGVSEQARGHLPLRLQSAVDFPSGGLNHEPSQYSTAVGCPKCAAWKVSRWGDPR